DVTTHGSGPVAVDHSEANNVVSHGSAPAVFGSDNKITGDVTVDLHHVSGNANVGIGDHNTQSAEQVDASSHTHVVDFSTRDSYNTHTQTDDHSNHSINDNFHDSHDTTHTVDDSFNHPVDSHDTTHVVDDSFN